MLEWSAPFRPAHCFVTTERLPIEEMALTLSGDTLISRLHPKPPGDEPFSLNLVHPRAGRPQDGAVGPHRGIGAGEDVGGGYRCGGRRAGRDGVSGRAAQMPGRSARRWSGAVRHRQRRRRKGW
jgi:hypothetical protein